MRRLSRRLSERTRLKFVASLLVGVGLAAGMVAAQGASLLEPGTTTHEWELWSDTPLEVGPEHTLILDTRGSTFMLDAQLINEGVVQVRNTYSDYDKVLAAAFAPQVNRGRWIIDDRIEFYLEGAMDNRSGIVQIGAGTVLYSVMNTISGGRIHGMATTSQLNAGVIRDTTISGHVNIVPWENKERIWVPGTIAGTLTVDGTLGIKAVNLSESTLLSGNGRTVLNNGTIGTAPDALTPNLTIGAGHTLGGTGSLSKVAVLNQGTIENQRGELLSSNEAIVQQGQNAQIVVNGLLTAPSIQVQAGTLDMDHTGLVTGNVDIQQGRLVLHDFRDFDFDNGKSGAAIQGNLTLSDKSQVEVMAGHGEPLTIFEVWGAASLDGELILSFLDGARVSANYELIFAANSLQGSFRSLRVNGTGNLPWTFVQERVSENQLTVTITAVPEAEIWGLMLFGLGVVGWRVRRRAALHPTH